MSISAVCQGQSTLKNDFDFLPREVVVFEDDFSSDVPGELPKNWELLICDDKMDSLTDYLTKSPGTGERIRRQKTKTIKVVREGAQNVLEVGTAIYHLVPLSNLTEAIRDSFTLEFDYRTLGSNATWIEITFLVGEHKLIMPLSAPYFHNFELHIERDGSLGILGPRPLSAHAEKEPNFARDAWHHMAISFKQGVINVYRDSAKLLSTPQCSYSPNNILFRNWPTVRFSNIRIAVGPPIQAVNDLLTKKSLITHYVFFDVDSATIRPGSTNYLDELAYLLLKHPKVKLEINGHTDKDGSSASNLLLSQKRALAVKQALVDRGISASRLFTNGYGASRPLQYGNTAEIKALNRRVEFIQK